MFPFPKKILNFFLVHVNVYEGAHWVEVPTGDKLKLGVGVLI